MNDELQLLREFRAEVPAADENTRRTIYAHATGAANHRVWWRRHSLTSRRVKTYALVAVAAAAATAAALTATIGGAAVTRAQTVNDVVSQVQNSFGDNRIASASAGGSTLTVNLNLPVSDPTSFVRGTFEAQVLASAVSDAAAASQEEPVTALIYRDASGNQLEGTPASGDAVGSAPNVAPLASGACQAAAQAIESAAQAAQTSLVAASVKTLPFLGGTCVFEFQTSDPSGFAASAPTTVDKLVNTIGNPNDRPYLVQVDDENGAAQFVDGWVPGFGGRTWIHPGLSTAFVLGGSSAAGG
jgi:hypothetical protein